MMMMCDREVENDKGERKYSGVAKESEDVEAQGERMG